MVRRKGLSDFTSNKRKQPSNRLQKNILKKQQYKCAACGCNIGINNAKIGYNWDHIIPFSFLQDNPDNNWQALCSRCNLLVSDFVFDTKIIENAQFLKNQWILRKRLSEMG